MNFIGTPYVVHAEVAGQGKLKGKRFAHAWVEDDALVYDFGNGNKGIIPKGLYYKIGEVRWIEPTKYIRYSLDELMAKMDEHGTYGDFGLLDCKYEAGGAIEDPNQNILNYFNSLPFTKIAYISPREMNLHGINRDASYRFEEDNGFGEFDVTYLTDFALINVASEYGFKG
jgi:hypothetical protein